MVTRGVAVHLSARMGSAPQPNCLPKNMYDGLILLNFCIFLITPRDEDMIQVILSLVDRLHCRVKSSIPFRQLHGSPAAPRSQAGKRPPTRTRKQTEPRPFPSLSLSFCSSSGCFSNFNHRFSARGGGGGGGAR
ncbi:hypothetical protein LIA77_08967 [Sarocladium implicatum]|nr:hypothetical protein LIA77_08967 [Sarocladium implicatum]